MSTDPGLRRRVALQSIFGRGQEDRFTAALALAYAVIFRRNTPGGVGGLAALGFFIAFFVASDNGTFPGIALAALCFGLAGLQLLGYFTIAISERRNRQLIDSQAGSRTEPGKNGGKDSAGWKLFSADMPLYAVVINTILCAMIGISPGAPLRPIFAVFAVGSAAQGVLIFRARRRARS